MNIKIKETPASKSFTSMAGGLSNNILNSSQVLPSRDQKINITEQNHKPYCVLLATLCSLFGDGGNRAEFCQKSFKHINKEYIEYDCSPSCNVEFVEVVLSKSYTNQKRSRFKTLLNSNNCSPALREVDTYFTSEMRRKKLTLKD